MRNKYSILFFALLLGCSQVDESQKLETIALDQEPELMVPENIKKLLDKTLGNRENVFRGYDFGDDIRKIQESEVLDQFEDVNTHVGYSFDSPGMETVDILYFRDKEDRLNSIIIDVYMNSEQASKEMLQAFTSYFNSEYGESKLVSGRATWETEKVTVQIKMVKTKLDSGLQVTLKPS